MHFSKVILPLFVALVIAQQETDNNDDNENGATSLSVPAAGTTPTITSATPAAT
ncbi:MAG: hypothetical protein Q9184_008531, partial [Pyrenodesmia sp. 2 TL-2023]